MGGLQASTGINRLTVVGALQLADVLLVTSLIQNNCGALDGVPHIGC